MSSTHDDWDRHWQQYSETAEQNPAENYRRELILSMLGVYGSGKEMRIIDIGSGRATLAAGAPQLARLSLSNAPHVSHTPIEQGLEQTQVPALSFPPTISNASRAVTRDSSVDGDSCAP